MFFSEREIRLKDGRKCVLKTAQAADAADMLACLRQTSGESPFLLRYEDEVNPAEGAEREFILRHLSSKSSFLMIAVTEEGMAGNCGIMQQGGFRRIRHRCNFAIALKKCYWHLGLGRQMMAYALELAEQMGYEQVELGVLSGNDRAKALYESFGFEVTGRDIRAMKYDDGSYRDEFKMIKLFGS